MHRLKKSGFLACVTLMGLLPPLKAAAEFAATPQEAAMCQVMVYDRSDPSDRKNWMHMHHYCDCLRFINRAYASIGNWKAVDGNIQRAMSTCDYVLEHTTPDFYMRAEVHMWKGKAFRLDRQEGRAVEELMEAIRGNPKLAQAYMELADIQSGNKKFGKALKTVTEGLRYVPDSKPLQRRYTELGGKLPYPAPIEPMPVEAKVVKPDAAAASTPGEASEPAANAPATSAVEPVASPKIGSPTNPYCRFCPD